MNDYIDWAILKEKFQGRQAFINKVIGVLLQSHAETPAKLRMAASEGDLAQVAFVAHSFAGVAGTIYADKLRMMSKAVELQAKAGDAGAIKAAEELAVTIEDFMRMLNEYISNQNSGS